MEGKEQDEEEYEEIPPRGWQGWAFQREGRGFPFVEPEGRLEGKMGEDGRS